MNYELYISIVTYVLVGLVGLSVGSFLNVVIYRLPRGMSLANPPSHCPKCDYKLRWYDNIPVLSYLILGGKCRSCRAPISPRYTVVEISCMLLWLTLPFSYGTEKIGMIIYAALAVSSLIAIFFIDLEHMIIPDSLNAVIGIAGIAAIFLDSYTEWYDHLIGALLALLLFLAVYYISALVLGREGIGFGDVKMSFALGLLLGWQKLILALVVGCTLASVVLLVVRRIRRDDKMTEYPLGPFLSLGAMVALIFGSHILEWYLSLFLI